MKDIMGNDININDQVVYPRKTCDGNCFLAVGTVLKIKNDTVVLNAYTKPLTRQQICRAKQFIR